MGNAKYSDVIILTWVVSAINKVFKTAMESLGNSIFFLFNIVYIRLRELYGQTLYGHFVSFQLCTKLKHKSHFSILSY